jgi:hypothetical protein
MTSSHLCLLHHMVITECLTWFYHLHRQFNWEGDPRIRNISECKTNRIWTAYRRSSVKRWLADHSESVVRTVSVASARRIIVTPLLFHLVMQLAVARSQASLVFSLCRRCLASDCFGSELIKTDAHCSRLSTLHDRATARLIISQYKQWEVEWGADRELNHVFTAISPVELSDEFGFSGDRPRRITRSDWDSAVVTPLFVSSLKPFKHRVQAIPVRFHWGPYEANIWPKHPQRVWKRFALARSQAVGGLPFRCWLLVWSIET